MLNRNRFQANLCTKYIVSTPEIGHFVNYHKKVVLNSSINSFWFAQKYKNISEFWMVIK